MCQQHLVPGWALFHPFLLEFAKKLAGQGTVCIPPMKMLLQQMRNKYAKRSQGPKVK